MKSGVVVLGLSGLVSLASVAVAQEGPPARTGFQMDVRTGYSIPMGKTGLKIGADSVPLVMSDFTSAQVPFIVDLGAKVIPQLFLGGYFGLAFGGEGGAMKSLCQANGGACVSVGVQLGLEAQYHFLPGGPTNPWLGYGFGFESLGVSLGQSGSDNTLTLGGVQFARLMGGVDFRLNRAFGVGPFVDFSLGRYSSVKAGSASADISPSRTHEWLTLGARFVFFP
ncbi:MAG: hypothetical protein ABI488_18610 [Polyangiaceae bacterium]